MVSLIWVAGIIVIIIGLALLVWSLYEAIVGTGVSVQFIITIIIGIALVIVGAWLAKGGRVSVSA